MSTNLSPLTTEGTPLLTRNRSRNLAAKMGGWSAAHWKTATFGWLAFVALSVALGGIVGTERIDANATGPGESGRMNQILDEGFRQPAGEIVLIESRSLRATDPAFREAITDVVVGVSKLDAVRNVQSPLAPGNAGQIAGDSHASLVTFEIRGDRDDAVDRIDPVLETVAAAQRAHPDLYIGEFGDASAEKGVMTAYGDDLDGGGSGTTRPEPHSDGGQREDRRAPPARTATARAEARPHVLEVLPAPAHPEVGGRPGHGLRSAVCPRPGGGHGPASWLS